MHLIVVDILIVVFQWLESVIIVLPLTLFQHISVTNPIENAPRRGFRAEFEDIWLKGFDTTLGFTDGDAAFDDFIIRREFRDDGLATYCMHKAR